ncbi:SUKH-4 family immunity protein [Streptomyces sp. NPDC059785]|uniref:SUKH-4 family immunity protein n=1 Tax=unclassified Streptomyces TaxID=2593676 RepID=UPI00365A3A7D
MSTTDIAVGGTLSTTGITIGGGLFLTDAALDPYATRAETWHLFTTSRFAVEGLRETGPRATATATATVTAMATATAGPFGDVHRLALKLRERPAPAAARISTTYGCRDRDRAAAPDHPELTPPSPRLRKLLCFAAAAEELAAARGRSASLDGRFGPKADAEATAQLAAFFEGVGTGAPPYWKTAALIRPLARITGPGAGLVLDLPPRLLDERCGSAGIMRFEEIDFPSALTHEPTRRFLRDTGLPEDGDLFRLDACDMEVPLPTLTEYADDQGYGAYGEHERPGGRLPAHADRLIRLGPLAEVPDVDLVLDGATGAVLAWSEPDGTLRPMHADVSTLALTAWLLHGRRAFAQHPAGRAFPAQAIDGSDSSWTVQDGPSGRARDASPIPRPGSTTTAVAARAHSSQVMAQCSSSGPM